MHIQDEWLAIRMVGYINHTRIIFMFYMWDIVNPLGIFYFSSPCFCNFISHIAASCQTSIFL